LLFETADTEEINYRKRLRDAMLQSIGSSRFAIYHHIVRREVEVELAAEFPDAFSTRLDEAWRTRLAHKKLYVNDIFLTLIRRPLQGRIGMLDRLRGTSTVSTDIGERAAPARIRARRAARRARQLRPRLLGTYQTPQGVCSEPLEFLSTLYNGEMRPVLLPMQDLGAYLPYRRISFGQETVELGADGDDSAQLCRDRSRSRIIPARPRRECSTSCCACRSS
jgi:type IV secretion system protein VirB4